MKITLIHSIYRPYHRGGAEVAVETIAAGLQAQGHQVSVVTVGYQNKTEPVEGIKVYRIKPFNLFNFLDINRQPAAKRFFWHLLDMWSDVQTWRIYQALKQEQPELIIGHNLKGLGYYVPRLARSLKIKYVQTIHDMQYLHPSGLLADYYRRGLAVKIYGWFCRRLLGSPALVVFPSKFIKRIYDENGFFPHSPEAVLGNPLPELPIVSAPEAAHPFTCLYLGQLEMYKGIINLIEAFKEVRGAATLKIVGEGAAREAAQIMAQDDQRISFYGRLSRQELEQKIWSGIDLLVNPSQVSESFGLVVAEAFAHRLPAVASSIGALPELVANGQTGWLVPPGDKEALRDKLQEIIDNGLINNEMKERCLAKSKEFGVGQYLEKLLNLV